MAGDALREVFAEFGVALDEKQLADAQKKIDGAAKKVRTFPSLRGKVDLDAVERGSKTFGDRMAAMRAGMDRARGEKLHASLSRLSPRFARLSAEVGISRDEMGAFGALVQSVSLRVVGSLAAATAAAVLFARAFASDAMALRETARAARVTTTELQTVSLAGERAGVSAEATTAALNTLAEGLRAIESRTGGPVGALWRLGVRSRDTSGRVRATNDVLADLADRFDKVTRPAVRLRLATELFGSSARQMLEVLRGGRGTFRSAREELEALGGGVLPEAVEASRRFSLAQTRMRLATDSVRSVIAVGLMPALTWVTEKLARVAGWFARMARGSRVVEVALGALGIVGAAAGVAVLVAWAPVLVPLLKVAGVVTALVLIFDDLITFIEGGDSAIGRFIDSLFGVGTAQGYLHELREEWEAIQRAIEWVIKGWDEILHFTEAPALSSGPARAPARPAGRPGRGGRPATPAPAPPGTTRDPARLPGGRPYMDILTGGAARLPTAPGGAGGARQVTHHRVLQLAAGAIQINGSGTPQAVADLVVRRLAEEQQRRRDGAHPDDAED